MRVSIIVPAYNAGDTITPCLEALVAQRGLRVPPEIVVVDDGCTDNTAEVAGRFPQVVLLRQENRGAAAARNAGVAAAGGDIVLFTDADCVPDAGWAASMVKGLRVADVVVGETLNRGRGIFAAARRSEPGRREPRPASQCNTSNCGLARDLALRTPFDESLLIYGEDTDLGWRLHMQGHAAMKWPDARVTHDHPFSAKGFVRHGYLNGLGAARLHYKHRRWIPRDLAPLLFTLLATAAGPWVPGGLFIAAFGWALFVAALLYNELKIRNKSIRAALAALPLQIVWFLAKGVGYAVMQMRILSGRETALAASRRAMTTEVLPPPPTAGPTAVKQRERACSTSHQP